MLKFQNLAEEISAHLQWGDLKKISEKTGISQATVGKHLTGKSRHINIEIINGAIEVVNERKEHQKKLLEKVKAVFNDA